MMIQLSKPPSAQLEAVKMPDWVGVKTNRKRAGGGV
jgi:hypothetical protein